jgi:hypothetical protein
MKKLFRYLLLIVLLTAFISCHKDPLKINISSIREEVPIIRFDKELMSLGVNPTASEINALSEKYPEFTDLFTWQIIRIGDIRDTSGMASIRAFINDTVVQQLVKMVDLQFAGFEEYGRKLVKAFKHYRYYFPDKALPTIYTCISDFNESVFTAEGIVGISLDKYLGESCIYYPKLGIPGYKQRKMIPPMMPVDVMYCWGMSEFEISQDATTLLDHMVHEGKLWHFTEAMLPGTADTLLTGFSARQLKWCKRNEKEMWNYLIENKLLFSTKQMDIVRYINDGPATNGFPPGSPARTGAWIGRQIIRSYMTKNPGIGLAQLMQNTQYQDILNKSGYMP